MTARFAGANPTMKVTLYHNPRCSKSRAALQLLEQRGVETRVIEYLKDPPDRETLKRILARLGLSPRDLMRTKEAVYRELALDDDALSDDQLIDAMVEHPILIERPIAVAGSRAALGRPPERVLEVL
jgi:arsenate reductase